MSPPAVHCLTVVQICYLIHPRIVGSGVLSTPGFQTCPDCRILSTGFYYVCAWPDWGMETTTSRRPLGASCSHLVLTSTMCVAHCDLLHVWPIDVKSRRLWRPINQKRQHCNFAQKGLSLNSQLIFTSWGYLSMKSLPGSPPKSFRAPSQSPGHSLNFCKIPTLIHFAKFLVFDKKSDCHSPFISL